MKVFIDAVLRAISGRSHSDRQEDMPIRSATTTHDSVTTTASTKAVEDESSAGTVRSPLARLSTFCLPPFSTSNWDPWRHLRGRTVDTVSTCKKELQQQQQQQQQLEKEEGELDPSLARKNAAAAGQGGPRHKTMEDLRSSSGSLHECSIETTTMTKITTTTTTTVTTSTISEDSASIPKSSIVDDSKIGSCSSGGITGSGVIEKAEDSLTPPLGTIPSKSFLDCSDTDNSSTVAITAAATTTTTVPVTCSTTTAKSATIPITTTSKLLPIPAATPGLQPLSSPPREQRRPVFRSESMCSMPGGGGGAREDSLDSSSISCSISKQQQQQQQQQQPPNDSFYSPALRQSSISISGSGAGEPGSSNSSSERPLSFGAFQNRFPSSPPGCRTSFNGIPPRMSLEEQLTIPEDFTCKSSEAAPALPARLRPMISHGMARLAVNMKDAKMTAETWKVVLSLLKPEDAAKIKRYRFEKDRRLALGSQLLQRAVIAWTFGVEYSDILISRTEKGKPFYSTPPSVVTSFPNWNYNVSHHGDFVGIASEPVCLVGLDIINPKEKPRGHNATANDFFKAFHRHLSAQEWGSIYQAPHDAARLERFYRLWALKEAYTKAIGSGLCFSPRRIEITGLNHDDRFNTDAPYDPSILKIDGAERPNWKFKFSTFDNRHVACVSRGPPSDAIAEYKQTLPVQDIPDSPVRFGLESVQPEFDFLNLRDLIPLCKLEAFDASLVVVKPVWF